MFIEENGARRKANVVATSGLVVVAGVVLLATAFTGAVAAHDDGNGVTVHNSTKPLDQHGEVHHITVDRSTANESFYVDVHTADGRTVNTTRTYDAGTELTDLELELDPTIREDTSLMVAVHAENGTELAAETMFLDTVPAPTVQFAAQTHALDEHDEVHHITVDAVAANQPYYVDVHNTSGVTVNTTGTFDAGQAVTDLELELDPTLKSSENLTVAVHAENGTELAAETARVTTAHVEFAAQTHTEDEHDEVHEIDLAAASAGTEFYVDVHTANGTINTTETFAAGTRVGNLELELEPTLKRSKNVTVAVHATDGTELAAETARVTGEPNTDSSTETETGGDDSETETMDEGSSGDSTTAADDADGEDATSTDEGDETTGTTSGTGAGFGVVVALLGVVGALLLGRR